MENKIVTYHEQMTYEGNQLTSVRDNASRYSYAGATDFDGVSGQEYPLTYNDAGSLTSDAGRRIAWIDYDLMNNPVRIQFTNGNVTKYVYSATGEKLRVTYQTAVPNITVPIGSTRELAYYEVQYTDSTDYLLGGSLTLKNGRIDKYQFEEGYCQAGRFNDTKDVFTFYYYDRDHLGSIRQVLKAKTGSVVQSMNYYPFGAEFCDGSTDSNVQSHRYNGKEFDKMHGLNTYDYGARQYNPVTARWDRVDPLCEKYYSMSPYNYCGNNPINAIDPNGCDWISTKYGDELFVYYDSRILSQKDIIEHYYNGEERDYYDIQYVGTTGTVYQNTDNGPLTYYTLNSDGSFADASGNIIDKEVSIEGLLHIGNEIMITKKGANKNWYGSYLGPNNPLNNGEYIYAIPPIDKLDYAAFQHDKGYDSKNAASYFDALFYRPVRYDDWDLAKRAFGDAMNSQFGSKRSLWGLGAGTLFGVLAVDKYLSIPRSALYDIIR